MSRATIHLPDGRLCHEHLGLEQITTSEFSGFYEIESTNSLLAASVRGAAVTNGAAIVQSNFVVSANSLWYFVPTDSGYYRVMNVGSGFALAVQNSSLASAALMRRKPT